VADEEYAMSGTCYECGRPAAYTCDAAGCDHRMCQDHAVLRMLDGSQPGSQTYQEASESRPLPPDHEHLCLEHAG
jgi:hypothetical protein